MQSELLIGWQQEKAELKREVCRLQEELAESRAEREEQESRSRALNERLYQSESPSFSLPLRLESDQREWKRRVREGREREARQALLIHRLQNKVLEYRDRCQRVELQLVSTERRVRDEHSDSLESALIRLEEEQHRSLGLADTNALLREQLSQSEQANQALREDLQKVTSDWTRALEEAGQRDDDWQRQRECLSGHVGHQQDHLLSVWRSVVSLRRHCHTVKTAADRDLLQLRAEFSRLSSSLLSSCDSVSSSLRLTAPPIKPFSSAPPPLLPSDLTPLSSALVLPPPDSSSSLPPLTSSSTLGTFSLGELEHREEQEKEEERCEEKEREISELKLLHETKVFQLTERIEELSRSLQAEDRQKEVQRHEDTERSLQSVSQAVVKLVSQ